MSEFAWNCLMYTQLVKKICFLLLLDLVYWLFIYFNANATIIKQLSPYTADAALAGGVGEGGHCYLVQKNFQTYVGEKRNY